MLKTNGTPSSDETFLNGTPDKQMQVVSETIVAAVELVEAGQYLCSQLLTQPDCQLAKDRW